MTDPAFEPAPEPAPGVSAKRSGRRVALGLAAVLVPMISMIVGWGATGADLHPDDWRVAAWGRVLGCFAIPFAVFRIVVAKLRDSGGGGPGAGCLTLLCLVPAGLALPAAADLWCGPETEVVDVVEVRPHHDKIGPRGQVFAYSRVAHSRVARLSDGRELRLPERVELRPGRREIVFLDCLKVVLKAAR